VTQYPQDPNQRYDIAGYPIKPKKHTIRNIVLVVVGVLIAAGIAAGLSGGGDPSATPSASPNTLPNVVTTDRPATAKPTTPTEPAYGAPSKADFKLTPKVLSKKCFGSAGCNVTYRILVSYTGPTLDPSESYELVYEVRGGEDGPTTNTLTVTGGESSVDEEEYVSTNSKNAKLTAVVTDVL
jgi:hypothetical protein